MTVRTLLLARGTFNVLFAIATWMWMQTHGEQRFDRGGTYALVDGVLGVVLATSLFRSRGGKRLYLPVLCDGLIRMLIGSLLLANPGIQGSILGSALYSSVVILACLVLGLGGGAYAIIIGSRMPRQDWVTAVMPTFLVSVLTLLLGIGLAVGLLGAQQRTMLAAYTFMAGLVLLWSGWRFGRGRPRQD